MFSKYWSSFSKYWSFFRNWQIFPRFQKVVPNTNYENWKMGPFGIPNKQFFKFSLKAMDSPETILSLWKSKTTQTNDNFAFTCSMPPGQKISRIQSISKGPHLPPTFLFYQGCLFVWHDEINYFSGIGWPVSKDPSSSTLIHHWENWTSCLFTSITRWPW